MNESETTQLVIKMPPDVRAFIVAQAKRNVSSQRAEIVRSVRERMEREEAR
jgi:hypothetical protein